MLIIIKLPNLIGYLHMDILTASDTRPSKEDVALAQESLSTLLRPHTQTQRIDFRDDNGSVLRIPTSVLLLLQEILTEVSKGNTISIIPRHAELTTQEAADNLGVSQSFLIQLLEEGEIPFRVAGAYKRVRYQDVVDYKKRIMIKRLEVLDELVAQSQELGLGY
jgi:excisionase family DNA binding protein